VSSARNKKISGATKGARQLTQSAKKKQHQKRVEKKSWTSLADDWQEQMWHKFGHDIRLAPWSKKEQALARFLLKEVEYETAEKMIQLFVQEWEEAGLPAFSYLWTRRESVLAMVKGQVSTKKGRRDIDEYDAESFKKQPKVGWG